MATHLVNMLNWTIHNRGAEGVSFVLWDSVSVNELFDLWVLQIPHGMLEDIMGAFVVPNDFSTNAKFLVRWAAVSTGGTIGFSGGYSAHAEGEDADVALADETFSGTPTAPSTTLEVEDTEISLTSANFAALDLVLWEVRRNASGSNSGAIYLIGLFFQYDD